MFEEYREDCHSGIIGIGRIWWWAPDYTSDRWIICFPTKQHWRNPSKLEWIDSGLKDLREQLLLYTPKSIAIPKLGCANGGLNWEDVHPLITKYLGDLETEVRLYVG
jgi:O-acetyl-ADP-ribose deacetylase (regulator of RNase III)